MVVPAVLMDSTVVAHGPGALLQLQLIGLILLLRMPANEACKISEFPCRGGAVCLPLDKYCDGRDDCGDASDEPKLCTVCNRTYYGDVGRTYSLRVPPPQWTRLPFLCHLTFTASGHEQGDIVQIIFDGFSVGRFDEGLADGDSDLSETALSPAGELPGCPEGFMQLSELGRPFTGGSWCGSASGHQLYYSETSTVTASVKVFHPPIHGDNPFEFRIRYKFISQSDAVVRYGSPSEQLELGLVTPGTYCTRQFDECYRKKCRLQSPNYPGMYPRNVTCYWTIRQKVVPTCKHAMVGVSQESEHKSLVKRSIASLNKTTKAVRAWSDCTGERDHLIFYDGSSTNDPVLAKYCGGDWLPKVTSRGPEMLVAFHSSPFSAPLQTGIPNRGFELDVDISFSDSDSHDFAKEKHICEFHINASNPDEVLMSRRGRMGRILSPRHTLPPNTTCTYYFYGNVTDRVWIYFTNYHLQILQPPSSSDSNSPNSNSVNTNNINNSVFYYQNEQYAPPPFITRMRIWDSTNTSATARAANGSSLSGVGNNANSGQDPKHQYYFYGKNEPKGKQNRINVDSAWNPIDAYVYGPTRSSVFNQNHPYGRDLQQQLQQQQHQDNQFGKDNSRNLHTKKAWDRSQIVGSTPPAAVTDPFNYVPNPKYAQNQFSGTSILGASVNPNSKYNTFNVLGGGMGAAGGASNYNPYSGTSITGHSTSNNNLNPYQFSNNHVDILNPFQTIPTIKSSMPFPSSATSSSFYSSSSSSSLGNNNQRGFGKNSANTNNNYNNNENFMNNNFYRSGGGGGGGDRGGQGRSAGGKQLYSNHHHHQRLPPPPPSNRKLLLEIYDNETPKLCDHSALEGPTTGSKTRPCSPLESYVSTGSDMKIEFQSQTGTALYPALFTLHYEYVDTNLGGEPWLGRKGEEPVPELCSRIFKKRRGEVRSPRNVFLFGRGGAKNLTCLYRFEAGFGERIRLSLHNVSFGDTATCVTESDLHTGRAKCSPSDSDPEARVGELKIFDVPYRDVKIPLGCFCDNTSSLYNTPITFQSNSKTMELMFTVTKLNISEDFADIYFHASYEVIQVPDCRKTLRLRGSGGEEEIQYPLRSQEATCDGHSWYVEAQQNDRSLFVLTWGSLMSFEPSVEEVSRCNTRNRLIIYAGRPLKVMRVICPAQPHSRSNTLHIFSEDWLNSQPLLISNKPVIMVLEPVMREPGNLGFSWLEIQRTKSSLLQQFDLQTNFTANDTFNDIPLFQRKGECEHKCPELDACIGASLWCDGRVNCPSGYDESEVECGAARRLLELPGGIYAALGCVAAACTACLIFCFFGLVRKRKKAPSLNHNNHSNTNTYLHSNNSSNFNSISHSIKHSSKSTLNGTLSKKKSELKKSDLYMDPAAD